MLTVFHHHRDPALPDDQHDAMALALHDYEIEAAARAAWQAGRYEPVLQMDDTSCLHPQRILDQAYSVTQNIVSPWVALARGTLMRPVGEAEARGRCRSTSIGDIIVLDGCAMLVCRIGFMRMRFSSSGSASMSPSATK